MFIIGVDVICVFYINVEFIKLEGLWRCLIVYICGCVFELFFIYDFYVEFCVEFINVLVKEKW